MGEIQNRACPRQPAVRLWTISGEPRAPSPLQMACRWRARHLSVRKPNTSGWRAGRSGVVCPSAARVRGRAGRGGPPLGGGGRSGKEPHRAEQLSVSLSPAPRPHPAPGRPPRGASRLVGALSEVEPGTCALCGCERLTVDRTSVFTPCLTEILLWYLLSLPGPEPLPVVRRRWKSVW